MTIKTVYRVGHKAGVPIKLAAFALADDGTVIAVWYDDRFRESMEVGIVTVKDAVVRQSDGQAFFDALDTYFAASSFVDVVSS